MKTLQYLAAATLGLLALMQLGSILSILASLLQGQDADAAAFYVGKLGGHLLVTVLVLWVAVRLVKSARRRRG